MTITHVSDTARWVAAVAEKAASRSRADSSPRSRALAFMTLLSVTTACGDLLSPEPEINPRMRGVWIESPSNSARIMYIHAYPADTAFRLQRGHRIPVEIRVSSGDRETAQLYRYFCPAREYGPVYGCFEFTVRMRDGFDAADLAGRVEAAGGRLYLVWDYHTIGSGRWATITLFSPDDLVGRAHRARSWPGVDSTSLSWQMGSIDGQPPENWFRSLLRVPVPVDAEPAVRGDGVVQARRGDTVEVIYAQPLSTVGAVMDRAIIP